MVTEERLLLTRRLVEHLVTQDAIVGAVLYVSQGTTVLLHEAFGLSDREQGVSMRPDTICRMRSMTKPLVGTAVLMLVEEGRLAAGERVAKYLPAFGNPEKRDITVHQLLTHTSGLTGSIYDTLGGTAFTSLLEAVENVGRHAPMGFRPGTGYHYSDPGSSTLGALVEVVSGMRCEQFIHERILSPLGMADSFCELVPDGDPRRQRIAATYRGEQGAWVKYWDNSMPQLLPFFRASGGLYSSAEDYARFMRVFLDEGCYGTNRLLSPDTVRLATKSHTSHLFAEPLERYYGYHWFLYTSKYAHVSMGTFGHGGSDGTIALADPETDVIAVYLTQSRGNETRQQVIRRLFGEPVA